MFVAGGKSRIHVDLTTSLKHQFKWATFVTIVERLGKFSWILLFAARQQNMGEDYSQILNNGERYDEYVDWELSSLCSAFAKISQIFVDF